MQLQSNSVTADDLYALIVRSRGAPATFYGLGSVRIVEIGRRAGCDVTLAAPTVSKRHAVLIPSESGHSILDVASGNGTFVNGELVTRAELRHGDRIRIGPFELEYWSSLAAPETQSTPQPRRPELGEAEHPPADVAERPPVRAIRPRRRPLRVRRGGRCRRRRRSLLGPLLSILFNIILATTVYTAAMGYREKLIELQESRRAAPAGAALRVEPGDEGAIGPSDDDDTEGAGGTEGAADDEEVLREAREISPAPLPALLAGVTSRFEAAREKHRVYRSESCGLGVDGRRAMLSEARDTCEEMLRELKALRDSRRVAPELREKAGGLFHGVSMLKSDILKDMPF